MPTGDNQPNKKVSDADFANLFGTIGPGAMVKQCGMTASAIFRRRRFLEKKLGRVLVAPNIPNVTQKPVVSAAQFLDFEIENGTVLISSDQHYWPGIVTTAHKAFVKFCNELKPSVVIVNGDVMDGASISRHPPIGWEKQPTLIEEIEAAQERLGEIMRASPKARHAWPLGNHDMRFSTRLASVAPEYAKIHGTRLQDHFGGWEPCWAAKINDDTIVKHRFKNGTHATHNATLWAGKTIVTGHLHSLKVTPFSDYGPRTRWGVDCGTLAEPYGPMFTNYCEMNPVNWRSGFVVLTYFRGVLLWPELVSVFAENQVEFRGKVYNV